MKEVPWGLLPSLLMQLTPTCLTLLFLLSCSAMAWRLPGVCGVLFCYFQVAWFRLLFGPAPVVSTWKGENTPLLSLALFISNIWQLAYSTWFNIFYMHFPLKIMSVTKPRDIRSHSSLVTTHTLPTPRAPIMSLGQVLGLPLFPLQMASFSHWNINIILFIPSQCLFRCPAWACGKPHF